MRACHEEIARWMEPIGAQVRLMPAGNFRGFYPALQPNSPRLLIGSHLDTVPNAGAYDGILGVVIAVALLEELRGRRLPFSIEVVGFQDEEGYDSASSVYLAAVHWSERLDQELLCVRDVRGISVRRAIEEFGLNPEKISQAELDRNTLGYLEFHIEQGPVLWRN